MSNNCTLITINGKTQANPERPSPLEVQLGSQRLIDAISQLWDYQTRSEMEAPELDRYVMARRLVRTERFENAKVVLSSPAPKHAESFNLLGVIYEALSDFDNARHCYGKAASLDGDFWAAKMNARRIYELHAFGHSSIPMYL